MSVTSWPLRDAGCARGWRRPCRRPRRSGVHQLAPRRCCRDLAGADGLDEDVDRGRGRADRAQAALGVELRAGRVEHADDDAATPKRFWATWATTRFVLSPSVATTTASASSIPASRSTSSSMPWPTMKPPLQSSPSRLSASSFSSIAVTSQPSRVEPLGDGRADAAAADDNCLHAIS